MRDIRMADLNIITAHLVGFASRTEPEDAGYPTKAILARKDPVALDYIASRDVLMPLTRTYAGNMRYLLNMNDVEKTEGPFYCFLKACHEEGIGNISPSRIRVYYI